MRQRVCNDPSITIMIPGRPGDGITNAPLSCYDDIAQTATFKAPQLRNVALTAPYFHNGSQLTLELSPCISFWGPLHPENVSLRMN
jgi:cytochrome c peroxidase